MTRKKALFSVLPLLWLAGACGASPGDRDAGASAARDAGPSDAEMPDAAQVGGPDAEPSDAEMPDAEMPDAAQREGTIMFTVTGDGFWKDDAGSALMRAFSANGDGVDQPGICWRDFETSTMRLFAKGGERLLGPLGADQTELYIVLGGFGGTGTYEVMGPTPGAGPTSNQSYVQAVATSKAAQRGINVSTELAGHCTVEVQDDGRQGTFQCSDLPAVETAPTTPDGGLTEEHALSTTYGLSGQWSCDALTQTF